MEQADSSTKTEAKRGAMVALSLAMLLASLGTSIANIALPALSAAFDAPFAQVQLVVVAYLASLTVSAILAGRLGDRFGHRRMLLAGLGLYAAASAFCGLSAGIWTLVAARSVQGFAAAFLMTLTIALVREAAAPDRIGRAMGLLGTMSAVGTALGPSLGGFLIAALDWRAVFLVLVPVGLAASGMALRYLPADKSKAATPAISFAVLRDRDLAGSLIANLLVAAVMMTTLIVGPFYLGLALGLPEAMVGLVMTAGPVISIFSGVPSGRLVDARGPRSVLAIGLIALGAGSFALTVLPELIGVAGYIVAIAVLTPGYQLFQAANNTAVMAGGQAGQRGTLSGLLNLSRNLGLIAGASAMGAVFSFGAGTGEIEKAAPGAIAGGMQLAFAVAAGLIAVAFLVSRRPADVPAVQDGRTVQ
ncbi:MAG: MFS transporter [Oricola sp.]